MKFDEKSGELNNSSQVVTCVNCWHKHSSVKLPNGSTAGDGKCSYCGAKGKLNYGRDICHKCKGATICIVCNGKGFVRL